VTRQKELDLAKAKVEAQQAKMATKQAEIALQDQKMADRTERWREKNRERTAKLHLLQLREQRGMGSTNHPTDFGGMHAAASDLALCLVSLCLLQTTHLRIHQMNNQAYSNIFLSTSSSSSYYHGSSTHHNNSQQQQTIFQNPMNLPSHMPLNRRILHTQVKPCPAKVQKTAVNIQAHRMSSSFHNPFQ